YVALPFFSPFNPNGSLNINGTPYSRGEVDENGVSTGTANINGFLNTPYLTLNTNSLNTEDENELKIVGRVGGNLEIVKNVSLGSSIGMDYQSIEYQNIVRPESIRGDITPDQNALIKGSHFQGYQRNASFIANTN